jgi:ribonuclease VapC
MIVDSSALVALVNDEPEADTFLQLMGVSRSRTSVATWLEACLVVDSRSPAHARRFDELVEMLGLELVPVAVEHARLAREAHRRFGRGSGSPARLNYGDCFAYALAVITGEPLLFKGDDFRHTDITPAWLPGSTGAN